MIGVVRAGPEQDRLPISERLVVSPVGQEALVAIGPQPAVERLDAIGILRPNAGAPPSLEGSLEKLRQNLLERGALRRVGARGEFAVALVVILFFPGGFMGRLLQAEGRE